MIDEFREVFESIEESKLREVYLSKNYKDLYNNTLKVEFL